MEMVSFVYDSVYKRLEKHVSSRYALKALTFLTALTLVVVAVPVSLVMLAYSLYSYTWDSMGIGESWNNVPKFVWPLAFMAWLFASTATLAFIVLTVSAAACLVLAVAVQYPIVFASILGAYFAVLAVRYAIDIMEKSKGRSR